MTKWGAGGMLHLALGGLLLAQAVPGFADHCRAADAQRHADCCGHDEGSGPAGAAPGCDHTAPCCAAPVFLVPHSIQWFVNPTVAARPMSRATAPSAPLGRGLFRPPIPAS